MQRALRLVAPDRFCSVSRRMSPRVAWPAPGYPHVCSGDAREVRILIAHDGELDDALLHWVSGWHLRVRVPASSIPLAVGGLSRPRRAPEIAALAALPEHRDEQYAEIRLTADRPLR